MMLVWMYPEVAAEGWRAPSNILQKKKNKKKNKQKNKTKQNKKKQKKQR
jgi:hypothetical protein